MRMTGEIQCNMQNLEENYNLQYILHNFWRFCPFVQNCTHTLLVPRSDLWFCPCWFYTLKFQGPKQYLERSPFIVDPSPIMLHCTPHLPYLGAPPISLIMCPSSFYIPFSSYDIEVMHSGWIEKILYILSQLPSIDKTSKPKLFSWYAMGLSVATCPTAWKIWSKPLSNYESMMLPQRDMLASGNVIMLLLMSAGRGLETVRVNTPGHKTAPISSFSIHIPVKNKTNKKTTTQTTITTTTKQ